VNQTHGRARLICLYRKIKMSFRLKKTFFIEKEKLRFIDVFQLLTGEEFKARGICIDRNFFMARE